MKSRLAAILVISLIVSGCSGHSAAPPRAVHTNAADQQLDFDMTPVTIGQDDPCYARVAAETRKMLGIEPTKITRTVNIRFVAGTPRERIIAVYLSSNKPSCQHLLAITVIPPLRLGEFTLKIPDFAVRDIVVGTASSNGSATLTFVDRAGRHYVRKLVTRPQAFVVNYAADDLELYGPGPDEFTHKVSTEQGSRILYDVYFKRGFSLGSPQYYL